MRPQFGLCRQLVSTLKGVNTMTRKTRNRHCSVFGQLRHSLPAVRRNQLHESTRHRRLTFESLETRQLLATTVSPVFWFTGESKIEATSSTFERSDEAATVRVETMHLDPGAYTLWWVVFNNPEFCADSCRADDLTRPEVGAMATYGTGTVVREDGNATFVARLREGDVTGVPAEFAQFPAANDGLMDARKAEVHVVIRSHGAASDDPEVLYEQVTTLNGGCNPVCRNVQFAIDEPRDVDTTIHPVFQLIPGPDGVGDQIEGTSARLTRTDDRVIARVDAAQLEPAAYTLWWVIFNHPEYCVGECRADDLTNPAVGALATFPDGAVVGDDGKGTFTAELAEGDITGVPTEFAAFPGAPMGLIDARQAEVHLVLRTHGAASDDPQLLAAQLGSLNGGCNPQCKNVQGAIHESPRPIVLGDSNGDGRFDQQDIVAVLQAGKYRTGQVATFAEGDWNGDRFFDQLDILAALQTDRYVADAMAVDTILADESEL
jgi:hypothetical protein